MTSTELVVQRPAWLPQSYAEVERMAIDMAEAKMVPTHFQKSRGDCMQVIRLGLVWEMDPFMLAQECYSINGRLMPSGKLAAAVINARGNLAERLNYEYSGEGDSRAIKVIGRLQGEDKPREVEVKLKSVLTKNEQWQKQPDQQLMYAGARTWGRRHVPELLLGVTFYEETDAFPPQAPRLINDLPKIATPPLARSMDELVDPETGEVLESETPRKIEGVKTWADFLEPMTAAILQCADINEYDRWIMLNQDTLLKLKESKPELYKLFDDNIDAKRAELTAKMEEART
ncbi:hypothetical protein ACVMGC_001064 [Bradyrhizobium barranii subsp. barranii]|uniref:hypothetical protein n=1 Tax=Bradyrhizobium TaxID=374 RepID=UPI001BA6F46F|nr:MULTISPECIES: hypothetical protein [Bradyrhizobium]MBR0879662.1 hypothetical protein [Bradyrhizobium liaoningense]MCP1778783.1 hypothetical protein [Bradyrhizobium japonicum]MCP1958219.1 hypothetical protein [Bradyrhizobium japonicum]